MEIRWTAPSRRAAPDAPVAMQQHPNYGAACAAWGREARVALILDGGEEIGAVQVVLRRCGGLATLALASRGPVWSDGFAPEARGGVTPEARGGVAPEARGGVAPEARGGVTPEAQAAALRALRRHLPGQGMGALLATPDHGTDRAVLRAAGLIEVQTPLHVAEIDLTAPAALRRAAQGGKWRNRLARAEAQGLKVRRAALPADPSHWLLRAEGAQQRARGYRGLPPGFAAAWASVAPRDAQVFSVERAGAPVAAMLMLIHGRAASYHIGWSDEEGRRLNAHSLILWRASEWLARRGVARLDLGTVNTKDAPGLARFKIGAGAQVRALPGTWLGVAAPRLAHSGAARLWGAGRTDAQPSELTKAQPTGATKTCLARLSETLSKPA